MKSALTTTLGAFAFVVASAVSASAVTVDVLAASTQGGSNTAGIAFAQEYGAFTPAGATWTDAGNNVVDPTFTSGNVLGQSQSPFNSNTLTDTRAYFTVGGVAAQGGTPSPVTLTFNAVQTSFKILWGSIDDYNTLAFYLGGVAVVDGSFTGTDIIAEGSLGGTASNFERVALVYFSGLSFDSVKFTSTQEAFEFALVPIPAGGLLLLTALGGIAALRRRKTA